MFNTVIYQSLFVNAWECTIQYSFSSICALSFSQVSFSWLDPFLFHLFLWLREHIMCVLLTSLFIILRVGISRSNCLLLRPRLLVRHLYLLVLRVRNVDVWYSFFISLITADVLAMNNPLEELPVQRRLLVWLEGGQCHCFVFGSPFVGLQCFGAFSMWMILKCNTSFRSFRGVAPEVIYLHFNSVVFCLQCWLEDLSRIYLIVFEHNVFFKRTNRN